MEESAETEETNDWCGKHNLKNLSGCHQFASSDFKRVLVSHCWSDEPADSKVMKEQFNSRSF